MVDSGSQERRDRFRDLLVARAAAGPDSEGDLGTFRTFPRQPFHRERPVEQQLRRLLGATGDRTERCAGAPAERLEPSAVPRPLVVVLAAAAMKDDTGSA